MTPADLVLTKDDIKSILKNQIVEMFYTMYKGLSANDWQGVQLRKSILASHWLLVLKGFFVPPHVIQHLPSDLEVSLPHQSPELADHIGLSRTFDEQLDYAWQQSVKIVFQFNGYSEKSFQNSIIAFKLGRKLDVLVHHFKIPEKEALHLLYTITRASNQHWIQLQQQINRPTEPPEEIRAERKIETQDTTEVR